MLPPLWGRMLVLQGSAMQNSRHRPDFQARVQVLACEWVLQKLGRSHLGHYRHLLGPGKGRTKTRALKDPVVPQTVVVTVMVTADFQTVAVVVAGN